MSLHEFLWKHSNFYRLHLAAFVFLPLIFSGIFYASNGRYNVKFVDAVFLCYSAMTDTGLSTVNLSTLTVWQQFILYFLMAIGNVTVVSWIMVLVRKQYFRKHITSSRKSTLLKSISGPTNRRINGEPILPRDNNQVFTEGTDLQSPPLTDFAPLPPQLSDRLAFSKTISFTDQPGYQRRRFSVSPRRFDSNEYPETGPTPGPSTLYPPEFRRRSVTRRSTDQYGFNVPATMNVNPPASDRSDSLGPLSLLKRSVKRLAPSAYRKVERSMTIPSMVALEPGNTKWLSFDGLVVGRNSAFVTGPLTDEQLEELGGVEYRALKLLSYLVPAYFVLTQLISFLLFAPWLSATKKYDHAFEQQPRYVQKPWYSMFLIMSAYTGTGLDLVDLSMVPFQDAYLMIFSLIFILLAGNHALPIFLRFIIWLGSRFTKNGSGLDETLSFLLHHPRRCFMMLFPSHQTWFLFIVLVILSAIEWISFGVLNLGLPVFESLPIGPRVVSGLFQGMAVRASGLVIVPIGSLAPALLFLYLVLMYIAVYPVAMCIRATNVYEERSLGIFEPPVGELVENLYELERRERIGRYLGWHLKRQLSLDIWWLVWGIFVIAIIERKSLIDPEKPWFNIFAIMFELVSAFGSVGLSLGLPNVDNFSLSGDMRTLSKLVITVLMIRGRHRGLPVAVDRAVLLPSEMVVNRRENSRSDANLEPATGTPAPADT